MVRAILGGTKTMTRRVVTPPRGFDKSQLDFVDQLGLIVYWEGTGDSRNYDRATFCPYGIPGDRPWVRETFCYTTDPFAATMSACYRADMSISKVSHIPDGKTTYNHCNEDFPSNVKWNPSIFMPRILSRITLEITNVRVERLQEISEDDCKAEGIDIKGETLNVGGETEYFDLSAREQFPKLWDSLNAKRGYSWESNPWVWVISFKHQQESI